MGKEVITTLNLKNHSTSEWFFVVLAKSLYLLTTTFDMWYNKIRIKLIAI